MTSDDNSLVEGLQKGDEKAFNQIYEKYSGKLYLFGLKYLRTTADAEELVQSVFLKVWKNHETLKKDTSFKSYVFTIAYNEICNIFRKKSYFQKFITETYLENPHCSYGIEDDIDRRSAVERVLQIINELPERQRIIFLKSRKEGKTTKEIAQDIQLSPGTVDNYISESLKYIRKKLSRENLHVFSEFTSLRV